MELHDLSLAELSRLLRSRKASAVEAVLSCLKRTAEVEPQVRAYLHLSEERALRDAREADRRLASGEGVTPLTGVPISLKDLLCTKDAPTTCASRILEGFRPPFDATVVARLRQAGAVLTGKTNLDEFAMGSSTENSAFGPTRNPWDLSRVPGGSSGGSAASVAAGECLGSLGTDTGGSIRQPAALCGVVGLKPTYGRVSRYGAVAFASSLDQIGPLTRTVEDNALLFAAVAGWDPKDATSARLPLPDLETEMAKGVKGLKVGLPKEYFPKGLDGAVRGAVEAAVRTLESLGASVEEVSLPHTDYALSAYYLLAPSEASSNLARYDGVRYGLRVPGENVVEMFSKTRAAGFGAEVQRRILLGTYALSSGYYDAYYLKAQKVRRLIKEDFDAAFRKVDVLATPTAPGPAFRLGEKTGDPLAMYLADVFTIAAPVAGIPGMSLPCGFSGHLPVGLQLLGKPFDEGTLYRVGAAYQGATEWHRRRPEFREA